MNISTLPTVKQHGTRRKVSGGFTLLELIVTMGIFMVLGTAAMILTKQSASISVTQQGQAALNINLRNAVAQLQADTMNAGTGYFPNYDIPGSPLGITIGNASQGYDTLTLLTFDGTVVSRPNGNVITTANPTDGTMDVIPWPTQTPATAATLASGYKTGDILMVFAGTVDATTGMPTITTFQLKANGKVNTATGNTVTLTFTPNVAPTASLGTWSADPLGISSSPATYEGSSYLGTSYDGSAWVLKTSRILYSVNTTTHQLTRQVNGGNSAVIANNIIGFKVGAMTASFTSGTETDASTYTYQVAGQSTNPIADFRTVRSIRVSLVGRTTPDVTTKFQNTYDGGYYRVESASIMVNPRNLSIHD